MSGLKRLRNSAVSSPLAQRGIRVASRKGWLPPKFYNRLPPLGLHPVTSPGGREFTYAADLNDLLARGIVWGNMRVWESTSVRIFSELSRNARRVLDVGAYSGIYSLIACTDGPADVIAFEPNPVIRECLQRNIEVNRLERRVEVVGKAVSEESGTAVLSIPADTTAAYLSAGAGGIEVEVTTIDEVVGGLDVDLIKLDVEGVEPLALAGARRTIERNHPAVVVECLSVAAFESVSTIMVSHSYDSCVHLGPEGPRETSEKIHSPGHANYLWTSGKQN